MMYEKSVNFFYIFSILAPQGDLLGQSSPILALIYANAPLSICKISFPSDNLSMRYLLPKFVDFVDGVTDKKQ